MPRREVKRVSIAEFNKVRLTKEVAAALDQFNGGSFMECHTKVFEATGLWVEELVPVFQRMDALIATRNLRA